MPHAPSTIRPMPTQRRSRAKPKSEHRRSGRPSPIDTVIGHHRETGDPITVSDRIIQSIRAGNYFEPSCAAAGIGKATAYEWLKIAGKLRLRARGEPVTELDPPATLHELRCLAFSDAVDEAQAVWEVGANTQLEQLARGGLEITTVTEKRDPRENLLERTTKTETLAPNAQVLEWRLTRKFPERYRERVEITGHVDGKLELTIEERAAVLSDSLAAYLKGRDDAKAEAGAQ